MMSPCLPCVRSSFPNKRGWMESRKGIKRLGWCRILIHHPSEKMYRPATNSTNTTTAAPSVRDHFFSEKNYMMLETVLMQDFQEKNGGQPLTGAQTERLSKMLNHYLPQVYQKQGEKPLPVLNKEVLTVCSKDFAQYNQRREVTRDKNAVQTVMDPSLFEDTAQRLERLTAQRNETKALPPTDIPDFRISLAEDGPSAAQLFEEAKKRREAEALRTAAQSEMAKAEAGLQQRISADSLFRTQQDVQNRSTELVLRQAQQRPTQGTSDMPLVILPDRRDLLMGAVGSFDGMTGALVPLTVSPDPRHLGQANANPTIVQPTLASPAKDNLPQDVVVREDKIVSYREVENNLFIYSADRDWLRNNKENRYRFTVNFDPAANGQSFGPTLASQQKFKNIVRIELVKAILPGESLNVTVQRTRDSRTVGTSFQDNLLNFPFVTVRVEELENNNYGTDNELDRSFGVLQYDAQWLSDTTTQAGSTKGYLAMIPKHLKCQKEYYPTPLSTLQKMTIDIRRPNGELVSSSPDTFDIGGILAPQTGEVLGPTFPFTNSIKFGESPLRYNVMMPSVNGSPANFYINTVRYFSRFEVSSGDRIQISGYTYAEEALNDPTYGQSLRAFCRWINRPEGHIVLDVANTIALDLATDTTNMRDSYNDVGYANFIVIQARYQDPSTGSVLLDPFGANFGATLNAFGVSMQSPVRLINLNKQSHLVFRIITREMDSLPQLRPDNNY